jgi:hypothetical protein
MELLVKDALLEFVAARTSPSIEEYVERRYRDHEPQFKEKKVRDVTERVQRALKLVHGPSVLDQKLGEIEEELTRLAIETNDEDVGRRLIQLAHAVSNLQCDGWLLHDPDIKSALKTYRDSKSFS